MQYGFGFRPQSNSLLRRDEIVVDLFAGGGGASEALRQAIGREPDICINHDPAAIGMHAANHPHALHLCEDVWHADPRTECAGNPIGWLHASPDCTHFSQAKGGQPRSRATRSLSWVILRWAGSVRPRRTRRDHRHSDRQKRKRQPRRRDRRIADNDGSGGRLRALSARADPHPNSAEAEPRIIAARGLARKPPRPAHPVTRIAWCLASSARRPRSRRRARTPRRAQTRSCPAAVVRGSLRRRWWRSCSCRPGWPR